MGEFQLHEDVPGAAIIKAARENQRIARSPCSNDREPTTSQAKEKYFDGGKLGDITLARTW
jgi:hypothetical protein